MQYKETDFKAIHLNPIWRDKADFIFTTYLGCENGNNEWEQLWGRKIKDYTFIICCIPFFAESLSLGDEVETDTNFIVQKIIKKGLQITFRIWLKGHKDHIIAKLIDDLLKFNVFIEPYSKNLIAISASTGIQAQLVENFLQKKSNEIAIEYELIM